MLGRNTRLVSLFLKWPIKFPPAALILRLSTVENKQHVKTETHVMLIILPREVPLKKGWDLSATLFGICNRHTYVCSTDLYMNKYNLIIHFTFFRTISNDPPLQYNLFYTLLSTVLSDLNKYLLFLKQRNLNCCISTEFRNQRMPTISKFQFFRYVCRSLAISVRKWFLNLLELNYNFGC